MGIVFMILGFIWWWPVGLGVLAFLLARRRRYWRGLNYAGEAPMMAGGYAMDRWERKMARAQDRVERVRTRMERYVGRGGWFAAPTSGNRAFDDYRQETLNRLEEEQREFKDFLDRLRVAKDRAEFDAFMAARRGQPSAPDAPHEPAPPQG